MCQEKKTVNKTVRVKRACNIRMVYLLYPKLMICFASYSVVSGEENCKQYGACEEGLFDSYLVVIHHPFEALTHTHTHQYPRRTQVEEEEVR